MQIFDSPRHTSTKFPNQTLYANTLPKHKTRGDKGKKMLTFFTRAAPKKAYLRVKNTAKN
jgi:hypothetical protein